MKILLVKPLSLHPGSLVSAGESILPPLGLLYIAAFLRDAHEVKILDLDVNPGLEDSIPGFSPDFLGLTSLTHQFPEALKIAGKAKELSPGIQVVLGGPHASACPSHILKKYEVFDYCIVGEGEQAFMNLIEGRENSPGICSRKNCEAFAKPVAIPDLDALPFPARDMLKASGYHDSPIYHRRSPHATILFSRGCPYSCIFCASTKEYRTRSPENFVSELEMLYRQGIRDFRILDECFSLNLQKVRELCELILRKGLRISWNCQSRADLLDRETLKLMKRAGCYNLQIGVETGSRKTMERIGKRLNLEEIPGTVKMIRESGLTALTFFILGFPFEELSDIRETIEFASRLDVDFVSFAFATPYPGTPLWESSGIDLDDLNSLSGLVLYSPHSSRLDSPTLLELYKMANRKVYLRPRMILRILKEGLKGDRQRISRYFRLAVLENPILKR